MTLKRPAEILADIFARRLQHFRLACKNLTILILSSTFRFMVPVFSDPVSRESRGEEKRK